MTIRRSTPTLLYAHSAPGRWICNLTAAMDEAAAALCRVYWQKGRSPALRPVRIAHQAR